jgi:hypothetical protein
LRLAKRSNATAAMTLRVVAREVVKLPSGRPDSFTTRVSDVFDLGRQSAYQPAADEGGSRTHASA